jgi:hypothetical protein
MQYALVGAVLGVLVSVAAAILIIVSSVLWHLIT